MKLFYTVQVDVVGSGLSRGEVSAQVLDRLLNEFGDVVAGGEVRDVRVWPHDDSQPSGIPAGTVPPPVFG